MKGRSRLKILTFLFLVRDVQTLQFRDYLAYEIFAGGFRSFHQEFRVPDETIGEQK